MRPTSLSVPAVVLSALIGLSACGGAEVGEVTSAVADVAPSASDGSSSSDTTPSSIRVQIDPGEPIPPAPPATGSEPAGDRGAGPSTGPPPTPVPGADPSSVVARAVVPRITALVAPADDADPVATLDHPTAAGSPLVFLAIDGQGPPGWLEVRLPVQPNGTTGWVRRDEVTLSENPYRIEIDRASHRLQVLHLGRPWLETTIAVGTGATPTPVGEFYLLELLAPPDPTGPYGPYAFGLSGFSEVLDSFGGADTAIIGLHGTNEPEALGTDVSFGCIRLANDVMEQLATTLPLGTPVRIT